MLFITNFEDVISLRTLKGCMVSISKKICIILLINLINS